jgi:DNA gyrase subunit B
MITAIGTGIGDEFDIANLRYGRVIVMTDADVDGSHIRTLILTFLYRNMPELIDRGHVYIAVPPLYQVKVGNQEFYFEKDAQLEELLVRERAQAIEITDRGGEPVSLTERRYGGFVRALATFEGYRAKLQAQFGEGAHFVVAHRLVEHPAASLDAAEAVIASAPENGYDLSVLERADGELRLKVVEVETSAAHYVSLPAELVESPTYEHLRQAYEKVAAASGLPPFTLKLGKKTSVAKTFDELREHVLTLAKDGLHLSRFKGLGEMNPEQLWETTMDPARRLLVRVDVEDASAADQMFSVLMGDQVEPRRAFIEQNAKDARFLDV